MSEELWDRDILETMITDRGVTILREERGDMAATQARLSKDLDEYIRNNNASPENALRVKQVAPWAIFTLRRIAQAGGARDVVETSPAKPEWPTRAMKQYAQEQADLKAAREARAAEPPRPGQLPPLTLPTQRSKS